MVSQNTLNNNVENNDFNVNRDDAGSPVIIRSNHSDNTSSASNSALLTTVGGTSGGDPYIGFNVPATQDFSMGIDNSDNDILKITNGGSPSSGTELFNMTSAGERTMPGQPAFHSFLSTSAAGVTGGGGSYSIGTAPGVLTEMFDQGSNLSPTGIFTTPVSGIYYFMFRVTYGVLAATHTSSLLTVSASGLTNVGFSGNIGILRSPNLRASVEGSTLLSLPALTAVSFLATVSGGVAGSVNVLGNVAGLDTFITGWLVT